MINSRRGQISIDFVLAITIFLVLVGSIFSIVNSLDDNNEVIVDNFRNYDVYLHLEDAIKSSKYMGIDFNTSIDFATSNCVVNSYDNTLLIGSKDNNFILDNFMFYENYFCNSEFKIR